MSDLIDRQETLDALDLMCDVICPYSKKQRDVMCGACAMGSAFDVIRDQPSVQLEPQWIPCSERMPEYPFGCLVTVWDTDPITMEEFENILPYFVGWDGEQWNDGEGDQCPFEVIAWWPVPEPFKEDRDD